MTCHSLSGQWEFRSDEAAEWQSVAVPAAWESYGLPKDFSGPCWFRTTARLPGEGPRWWLRFDAVSYYAEVTINGYFAGSHTGLWDAFSIEITSYVSTGKPVEIVVKVEKPASLTAGPRSEPVPGAFPMTETLAGFLPYVWGHIFGGIWQDVWLESTGPVAIRELYVRGGADGNLAIEADLSDPSPYEVRVSDLDGNELFRGAGPVETVLPNINPWSPREPNLYQVTVALPDGTEKSERFGFRSVSVDGPTILLNGQPIYPRMALSWGWYPDRLDANPGPERVRNDLLRLQSLGYNGVKLCLWIPPDYYFDLADELGMLLWVEFPMWLPTASELFMRQTPLEYERIAKQVRSHPAIVCYTLGCELQNRDVTIDLMQTLFGIVKPLVGDALVRDNSGSGEAFGGPLVEFADFYDYHFYAELHHFRSLVDHFSPRWRRTMPLLFGEYCDLDAFRIPRDDAWWWSGDPAINPAGARWQYDLHDHARALAESGYADRVDEIREISRKQSLIHRKFTIETTRTLSEVSGYVITGERDTPISTAGMIDDFDQLVFSPEEFSPFNGDLVLSLGWDKRRAWVAGGDRPAPFDPFSYEMRDTVRPHFILSHYGRTSGPLAAGCEVSISGEQAFTGSSGSGQVVTPGMVREIWDGEFIAPDVEAPQRMELTATVAIGETKLTDLPWPWADGVRRTGYMVVATPESESATNSWPLWVFPKRDLSGIPLSITDPGGRLSDWRESTSLQVGSIAVATRWTRELDEFVRVGGRGIYLHGGIHEPGPLNAFEMPFWRECVRIAEAHPAWGDFPHEGVPGLQFFGMATPVALERGGRPILRRLDTRTLAVHDYATELEWGNGRLIVSTLRFEGGLGEQPLGLSRNTAARYLLGNWIRYLAQHSDQD
jgi:hypothetical protein